MASRRRHAFTPYPVFLHLVLVDAREPLARAVELAVEEVELGDSVGVERGVVGVVARGRDAADVVLAGGDCTATSRGEGLAHHVLAPGRAGGLHLGATLDALAPPEVRS